MSQDLVHSRSPRAIKDQTGEAGTDATKKERIRSNAVWRMCASKDDDDDDDTSQSRTSPDFC